MLHGLSDNINNLNALNFIKLATLSELVSAKNMVADGDTAIEFPTIK